MKPAHSPQAGCLLKPIDVTKAVKTRSTSSLTKLLFSQRQLLDERVRSLSEAHSSGKESFRTQFKEIDSDLKLLGLRATTREVRDAPETCAVSALQISSPLRAEIRSGQLEHSPENMRKVGEALKSSVHAFKVQFGDISSTIGERLDRIGNSPSYPRDFKLSSLIGALRPWDVASVGIIVTGMAAYLHDNIPAVSQNGLLSALVGSVSVLAGLAVTALLAFENKRNEIAEALHGISAIFSLLETTELRSDLVFSIMDELQGNIRCMLDFLKEGGLSRNTKA